MTTQLSDPVITDDMTPPRVSRARRVRSMVVPPLIAGVLIIALLELVGRSGILPRILFPSPFAVFEAIWNQMFNGFLWYNLWITLLESVAGFALGSAIGFALGVAIGLSRTMSRALYPYVIIVQAIPRVALAPLFIAFFGFGIASKIVISLAVCFFPVLINTIVGLRQADPSAVTLMRSFSSTRMMVFRKLLLPGALPAIMGGLKTALTLAFVGAIVGELIGANAGVGTLISQSAFSLRIDAMFGYILWLSFLSLAIFALLELADRKLVFWTQDVRAPE